MRVQARLFLAAALVLGAAHCSLLNPLDHLQAGFGRDGAGDASGEDAPAANGEGGGPIDGAGGPDADNAPGCGPARWAECGVSITATPAHLGYAVMGLGDTTIYVSDETSGEISSLQCTASGCAAPSVRVTGEDQPRELTFVSDSLLWTTRTAVRRLRVIGADAATTETIDSLTGTSHITSRYPNAMWTDQSGARGWALTGPVLTFWNKPASSPSLGSDAFFISENEVKQCTFGPTGTSCPGGVLAFPDSGGATAVAYTVLFTDFMHLQAIAAAVANGTGSRLVLLDRTDDAGARIVLGDDPSAVRAFAALGPDLFWTNAAGELRRVSSNAATPMTIVHGLSGDTSIDVSSAYVLIADRGRGQLLRYAR